MCGARPAYSACSRRRPPRRVSIAGASAGVVKKKKVVKLTRKQLKRKAAKRERGEGRADKRSMKGERAAIKLSRKQSAKELW